MATSSRFSTVSDASLDAIMQLDAAYREDPEPAKLNLVVGVYQTAEGTSPVLDVVKEAERRLVEGQISKNYAPMTGEPAYLDAVEQLLLGRDHAVLRAGRVASAHTIGGTGALRLAGEFVAENLAGSTLWIGEPSYPNHRGIFGALGIPCQNFPYYDVKTGAIREDEMYASLARAKAGDIVLLHGCCHNPTGADLPRESWSRLAHFLLERSLIPLVDLAYLGFADGIEEDAILIRRLFETCPEGMLATSFSKNFALYNERVGALSIIASTRADAQRCIARLRMYIRRIYSSPPAHGSMVVATVLSDAQLRHRWAVDVEQMRQRLRSAREELRETLSAHQVDLALFPGLTTRKGLFALTLLSASQVDELRQKHHVYMLPNGRLSVSGLTPKAMDRLGSAIAVVARR
jgi:aspartate/tyrosine/aromatic aminotransferase